MTVPIEAFEDDARVRIWLEIREPLERQLSSLGEAVISAVRPMPGEHVLDIGCGIGATPRALARAVGPAGRVVGTDILKAAINVVRQDPDLAENVEFICTDVESQPWPTGSFDVAFSRFGVMFFTDPVATFDRIRQALRPHGRLGFVCWRQVQENELDDLPLRTVAPYFPMEALDTVSSAKFLSFQDANTLRDVLERAGFVSIKIVARDEQVSCGGLQATIDVVSRVGALGMVLRSYPDLRPRAITALEQALRPRDGPNGLFLRAATWVVTAEA